MLSGLFRRLLGFGLARPLGFRRARRPASVGVLARGPPPGRLAAAFGGFGIEEGDRLVECDGLRRLVARQRRVDAVVADIGTVAPLLGDDRAALLRVVAERAAGRRRTGGARASASRRSASPRG